MERGMKFILFEELNIMEEKNDSNRILYELW